MFREHTGCFVETGLEESRTGGSIALQVKEASGVDWCVVQWGRKGGLQVLGRWS